MIIFWVRKDFYPRMHFCFPSFACSMWLDLHRALCYLGTLWTFPLSPGLCECPGFALIAWHSAGKLVGAVAASYSTKLPGHVLTKERGGGRGTGLPCRPCDFYLEFSFVAWESFVWPLRAFCVGILFLASVCILPTSTSTEFLLCWNFPWNPLMLWTFTFSRILFFHDFKTSLFCREIAA